MSEVIVESDVPNYLKKDFVSNQEVRWCPGCGDYSILASVQNTLPKIGKRKENICFVSGIGCSSRFPYYVDTYGMHTIHGRALPIASGLKSLNPKLSVWVATGDGDAMAIGGNHLIHTLRRNIDINILMFNNEIYGLTKGQYSPTTKKGAKSKSSPHGTIERPFSAAALAIGSGATFYARCIDTDPTYLTEIFTQAAAHKGTAFVEVYQNCVIFTDKLHDAYTNRKTRDENTIRLEHGKPMIFGANKDKGIMLDGFKPKVVKLGEDGITEKDLVIHDETDPFLVSWLSSMTFPEFPVPLGIFKRVALPTYEQDMEDQIATIKAQKGPKKMSDLLYSGETWEVK